MYEKFKRNLVVSSAISVSILIISSTASFISIRNLLDSNKLVNHTQSVISELNKSWSAVIDAQNGTRGFLITGKTQFLQPYNNAQVRTDEYARHLQELTIDNPLQQRTLKEFEPARAQFFDYLALRISKRAAGYQATPEDLENGKALIEKIKLLLNEMERRENALLAERSDEASRYGAYTTLLILFATFIALAVSGIFFYRILNDFRERSRLQGELEKKDKETEERIKIISRVAEQISSGNYDIRVAESEGDALGNVGNSLNSMAGALGESFKQLSDKQWLQSGIGQLNGIMVGDKNLDELTRDIIEFLATYSNSAAAVLYLPEGNSLSHASGFCYIPDQKRKIIPFGEGLTGQAASSHEILELQSVPSDGIAISYALGEITPAHVVAIPFVETIVEGVAELASVTPYTPLQMEFFRESARSIAIALKSAQGRKRIQELLEETQAQSEELSAQHSELESLNAELEVQTEKLQASEEELRVQQEELQQTNEELSERSVLLEQRNSEIQKKSEDLERSTRYKSEFLANMSHELRTPLNSILLLSRLLSENNEKNLSDEQTEFASVINNSGNSLLSLIDEILDLSKIEAGKMDLEYLDVPITDIADTMKGLFSEVARQKKIDFSITTENAPVVIKTDRMRIEQILKNLISNAIKFTSQGSVTVAVERNQDSRYVSFKVTDTGIGIAKEQQPMIFEAFQQADGSTKRKYGGTGLGLSISRELAKLLKGEITLESDLGKGSTFTLTVPILGATNLPYTPQASEPAEKPAEIKSIARDLYISSAIPDDVPDDRQHVSDSDKVILIVEDDIAFAKSLLEFTRQRGYKGIVCVRGDQAMELTLKYRPAGVLLDIQLPVKSGWEVIEELKSGPATKHIPVHMMSSHKLKQESLLKGAVNFMDKPIAYEKMPEIFERIEHFANRESQKALIIEDNPQHAKALAYFLETHNLSAEIRSNVNDSVNALKKSDVDCVILDMGIPDKQSYDVLEGIKKNPETENLPVIVFTGKSLSMKEEMKIKQYADSIIIKTAHSYQRMLDEVSLFLHLVEENKKPKNAGKRLHQLNNVLSGKTVLVVDDDVRNIYSLTKALEVLQMTVVTAIDGTEALKALEENKKIDVVLLDMMMPNMDGYETAERIRKNKKYKNLPVIAVTAKAMTGDREKCINAGASDYITKPVDVDQLLSLLRVWLYDKN
ncbi:MAG: response regulator [Flavobacterium sp.]|nr:MAG: response regulator [Flavobacterium sp.]